MAILKLDVLAGAGWGFIGNSLKGVSEQATKVLTDTERLKQAIGGTETAFKNMGLGALGALGIIAGISPSLAGDLAQLEVSGFRIADAIGKAAKPAFDFLASSMEGIASFLEDNPWASQLTAELLGVGAAVKLLNFAGATLGLGALGTAALGAAAPLLLVWFGANLLYSVFKDWASVSQQQAISKEIEDSAKALKELTGITIPQPLLDFIKIGSIGLAGFAGFLEQKGVGEQVYENTPLKGVTEGISSLGSLLGWGTKMYNPIDIFIDTLPLGSTQRNIWNSLTAPATSATQATTPATSNASSNFTANQQQINLGQSSNNTSTVFIQILDQNGQRRDSMIVRGAQNGVVV